MAVLELMAGASHLWPSHSLEAVVGVTFAGALPLYIAVFACKTKRNRRTQMASSSAFLNFCELMIRPGKVETNPNGPKVIYVPAMNT